MKNLKTRIFQITAVTITTLFMSTAVFAQVQETEQDTTSQDTTIQTTDQQQALPQEQNQRTNQGFDSQEPDKDVDYSETIDKNKLPQEVNSSLDELYPAHEITEVFKGDDDSYKVRVKNEDDEAVVYYKSDGSFLRAENLSGLQQEGALPQEQGQRTGDSQNQSQWGTENNTLQGTMGTDKEKSSAKKKTQTGTWGTGTDTDDDINTQQGTQSGTWGTDSVSDDKTTRQGTQESTWGTDTDTDNKSTQQGTQEGAWGTDSDTDDISTKQGTKQSGTWGTESGTMKNKGSAYPQEQSQRNDDTFGSQDSDKGVDYSETVEKSELPQELTSSLDELYPAHEISEIKKGDDDSYKVTVKNEDDKAVVYYSSEGEFLRAKSIGAMLEGAFPQEQGQKTKDSKDQDAWGHSHSDHHESQMGTGSESQMGTGSDTKSGKQGTQHTQMGTGSDSQMKTGTDNKSGQMGTQHNQMGTGSDAHMKTGTDNKSGQQGTMHTQMGTDKKKNDDNWGSDNQGAQKSTWGDDSDDTSTRENESSAYPQEQNQQTDDQDLESQGDRKLDKEWGANNPSGTRANRTGSQDEHSDSPYGISEDDTTKTQGYGTSQKRSTTSDYTSPQEQSQMTSDEEYNEEVEENDLPEAITTSLDELYPDHNIEKAYKGNDGSYKVKVKNQDDVVAVYYDSEGSFLKDEKKDSMKDKENKDTNKDW